MNNFIFSIKAIFALWNRNAKVWVRWLFPSITRNIVDPVLYFFSFGFGLGAVIETMDGIPYMTYIVSGMVCYVAMLNSGFETTIGSYFRKIQGTFDAILVTPVNLHQIMLGEVFWAATKALIASVGVMVAAYIFGAIPSGIESLSSIPIIMFGSIAFAISGLVFTSFAKAPEFFNYFFTFWVTPNFLFTGVFFTMDRFPEWVQTISEFIPMTHFIRVTRPLILGEGYSLAMLEPIGYLLAMSVVGYIIAYKNLKKTMFS